MAPIQQRQKPTSIDATGWLLATTIVVLAVLDLLIWATLWNVPNPVSKLLLPQAAQSMPADSPFRADPPDPRPASDIPTDRR